MFETILKRLAQPSSYAGLAAILLGADQVFNINEAASVAAAASQAGELVASGASPVFGIAAIVAGVLAAVRDEGSRAD